ncbi:MFS transporter [Janibacter corallicola]|uniref:MFS transporter n=1 Tax=Janibacter corallicola TaxID=415212 RepID=UPI000835AC34|nr:MFS transporter [Janibacter corallicola]
MTVGQVGSGETESFEPDPQRWKILWVLLLAIFMSLVGVSIVNVALPSIQQGLGASDSDAQWVLAGYALTFGVVLVAAGRAGDLMGRGGFFVLGVIVFTLSSVAAGLAPDPNSLNAARFIQGVGSGLLNPQGVGMIQQYFRGAERGRAFGAFGSVVGVAVGIGPVLGGLLIELGGPEIGWRLTFLVNVPVGLVCLALALRWFPRPLLRRAGSAADGAHASRSLDPVGSILLGLAVLATMLPFVEGGTSPWFWLTLPLGILLAWVWVRWERHYRSTGRSPMVDLDIFRIRSFTNGSLIVMLYFLGMTSIWVLVALYMQEGTGKSAFQAGLVGVPSALISAYAAHWAGSRVTRYGRKVVIGGLYCALLGLVMSIAVVQLQAGGHLSEWWLVASLVFIGIAQGAVISPNQTLTLAEVPLAYAGSSGAVMQTGQRIGTSIGIAVITGTVFATLGRTDWATATTVGFALIAVVVLVALVMALKDQRDRTRPAPHR